jgi:hypothetical protein
MYVNAGFLSLGGNTGSVGYAYGPPNKSPSAFRRNSMRQRRLWCSGRSWIMWQRWQNAARLASTLFEVS